MRYALAEDARPQMALLATAMAASIGLWIVSLFVPLAGYIVYPLQLFATFIHEAGHALAAVITGNSVSSLTVSPDTSGAVWSTGSGLSGLLISSAGYLGATAYGVALIVWIRFGRSSRIALLFSAGLIASITLVFGLALPILNILSGVSILSVRFTVLSGFTLAVVLAVVAKFASVKWANFAVAFLAVQCLLNAFFSLRDLFVASTFSTQHTDAATMAAATGIPSVLWVMLWFGISVVLMLVGFRVFASRRSKLNDDSVFINPS
jgi:hypothetical protein